MVIMYLKHTTKKEGRVAELGILFNPVEICKIMRKRGGGRMPYILQMLVKYAFSLASATPPNL
jgi:hypothetical protein